jgi:L-threonylcarbamoyladenylate synthase
MATGFEKIQTLRLAVDADHLENAAARATIAQAAEILRRGGTVAFPTETVYGLGANALRAEAVAKIFAAKERPSWDPLIVHVDGPEMLRCVAENVPENARKLIEAFWPGPLTLLLPKHADVPEIVTAGRPRVGVRMPKHPVALALIRAAGLPVAAPSANTFGRTSPTLASHVAEDLEGRIDAILDAGETAHGLESTVIDVCEEPCIVYRPGVITLEQIRAVVPGAVRFQESAGASAAEPASLPSPGVGIRHYAPRARVVLVEGDENAFREAVERAEAAGERVGVMLADAFRSSVEGIQAVIWRWGSWEDRAELGHRLFAGLRWLDGQGATVIVCPLPPAQGAGVAIRDRLMKAAKR